MGRDDAPGARTAGAVQPDDEAPVRAVMQVAGAFGLRMAAAKVALWRGAGERVGGRAGGGVCAQAGVALGGLAPNVKSVTDYINGGECAGLVPAGT